MTYFSMSDQSPWYISAHHSGSNNQNYWSGMYVRFYCSDPYYCVGSHSVRTYMYANPNYGLFWRDYYKISGTAYVRPICAYSAIYHYNTMAPSV